MLLKGTCDKCLYKKQEWHAISVNKKTKIIIDLYCGICNVFKRPDGYCDFWESE